MGESVKPSAESAGGVGIISADPITTHEQLEAVYQQAVRGRHISEIAPVLALRNKALDALSTPSSARATVSKLPASHYSECPVCGLPTNAAQQERLPGGGTNGAVGAPPSPAGSASVQPAARLTEEEAAQLLDDGFSIKVINPEHGTYWRCPHCQMGDYDGHEDNCIIRVLVERLLGRVVPFGTMSATAPTEELSQLYGLLDEDRIEDAKAFIRRWANAPDRQANDRV